MNPPPHTVISHRKETAILALMGVILLTGTYAGVGWSGFVYGFHSSFPTGAGYARTLLCVGMVLFLGARAIFIIRHARGLQSKRHVELRLSAM